MIFANGDKFHLSKQFDWQSFSRWFLSIGCEILAATGSFLQALYWHWKEAVATTRDWQSQFPAFKLLGAAHCHRAASNAFVRGVALMYPRVY